MDSDKRNQQVRCRLVLASAPETGAGERYSATLELENTGLDSCQIECQRHLLEHITWKVSTRSGSHIVEANYAGLYERRRTPLVIVIQPGEKHGWPVNVQGAIPIQY